MNGYFDKLYTSIYKKLQSPESVEWFPTYLCNSRCLYCGGYDQAAKSGFEGIIPYEKITQIVQETEKTGAPLWNIGGRGGEPLMYPNLIGVLQEIKSRNMQGILITNGLLLEEDFIKRLVSIRWDRLRISLDSHIADIHDQIRGIKGNFDKIDKALNLFKSFKKEFNTKFPEIICCPVITEKNYKSIQGYIEYCKEKNVEEIQFMPLINVHERAGKLMLSDDQKKELVGLLEERLHEDGIKHNIRFIVSLYKNNDERGKQAPDRKPEYKSKLYCIHLWKTLVISEDGYLSPCSLIKDKLLRINGFLSEAWDSGIINALRKKIFDGEYIDSNCKECCGPLRQETENFNRYLLKRL